MSPKSQKVSQKAVSRKRREREPSTTSDTTGITDDTGSIGFASSLEDPMDLFFHDVVKRKRIEPIYNFGISPTIHSRVSLVL